MIFKVTIQYGLGKENFLKDFKEELAARAFIKEELKKASDQKAKIYFRLYDFDDLMEVFDASQFLDPNAKEGDTDAASTKGQGSGFSPTPFNSAPKPAGMPNKWLKDEVENKQDKEKK